MAKPRLRVIAGSAGGRRLMAPGSTVRPTTDRVKESLFASLGDDRLRGASVLDLFAGSGALAIEALSRGAASAVLVERDHAAADVIARNLATTGFTDRARVIGGDVERFLGRTPPTEVPFDLVFLDPPYESPAEAVTAVLSQLTQPGWLAPGATVVVERPSVSNRPAIPEAWAIAGERSYGDTLLIVATSSTT